MEIAESSALNRVERRAEERHDVGIVTSSAAYNSVMDVAESYDLKLDVLKLGFSNPLPERLVATFLKEHKTTIVVEELDPILEGKIRVLAQLRSIPVSIHGKMDGYFPSSYEYNPDIVANSLSKILGFTLKERERETGFLHISEKEKIACEDSRAVSRMSSQIYILCY